VQAAPLFADIAGGPPGGRAVWAMAEDGVRLRVGFWPEGSDGTVLLFPGRTEYVEKYGITARALAAAGLATAVIDWRGQGLSERLIPDPALGHVDDFAGYQRDVRAMRSAMRALGLPEPFFLLAHSMGGAIALAALEAGMDVRAAAFSAPMWGIALPRPLRQLAPLVARLARALGLARRAVPGNSGREPYLLTEPFERNALTHDRAMWQRLRDQLRARPELALGAPTLGWLAAALAETARLSRLPSPGLPALALLGGEETVVDPGAVRARMAGWPGGALLDLDGARHEPLMEGPEIRALAEAAIITRFGARAEAVAAAPAEG